MIEFSIKNKIKRFKKNGKLHRLDGPAIEWFDGSKYYYQDDQLHRTDGPAVEWANGSKEYWIDGQLLKNKK